MTKSYLYRLFIALFVPCLISMAAAQTITGSIAGTVTDPSGAVVPGATVVIKNVGTGVETTAKTNSTGTYSVRFLQVGQYTATITHAGFQTSTTEPFALEVDQTAKIDGHLLVGAESQTATVQGNLQPILDTEDSTISTTLTANTIENIPLNGRNWSSLTLFLPGSVATNPGSFGGSGNQNAIERNQNGGGTSQANINGNRAEGNNYRLDGMEINETINNLVGYNPNPDALGQVQVISANAPAEYGNVNGGDIIALTKSGTNAFHGSAGAFLENYNLDANTWDHKNHANPADFSPRDKYTQTQYSATFGGPLIKDKLFFFMDYFGTRYHSAGQSTTTVLSALMRQGDFSELLDPNIMGAGKTIQLYDPFNNYAPYVGNKGIPITNPVAKYLIAHPEYYPLPNLAPQAASPVINNYRANQSRKIFNDQGEVKVDWTPTATDRISARWLQGQAGDTTSNVIPVDFQNNSTYPDKGIAINYVRTITPSILNEFRAGYTRVRWEQGDPFDASGAFGSGNSLLGIPGSQAYAGFSAQNIDGISGANIGNSGGGTNFIDNSFLYGDDLSVQRGHHVVKVGVEFLRYQQNNFYPGNDGALGRIDYGQDNNGNPISFTSNPNVPGAPGYAYADFLLDRAAFVGRGSVAGLTGQRQWRSAYFVQDDWKVRPNLTFNIGLRYEYFQPIYEVNDKQANVNYATKQIEYAGHVPANAPAGSVVCATRACVNSNYNNFMPRLGFAYQPTPRMVIRGGFGITKALEGTGANLRLTYNPPFQGSFEKTGTAPSAVSPGTYFTVEQGFTGNGNYAGFYRSEPADIKPQATNEYSLTTEYQINNASSFKLGYVGELSQHLIQAISANQLTAPCVLNGVVQSDPNSAACGVADPSPFQSLVGQNGFLFETATEGMANYNALQAQYRQRATKGLEYTVNYSYARAMTNSVGFFGINSIAGPSPYAQNAYDNAGEYGPAGSDIRHNLNGTAVYTIPFGRGRQYGGAINPILNEVLGGWKVAATALAYSGFPVTINGAGVAGTNNRASRPDQINNSRVTSRTRANWFGGIGTPADPSTFKYGIGAAQIGAAANAPQAIGRYGNAHVGTERAPGFQQYDFSAFKDFTVFREQRVGFRVDAFNALNKTSLGNPDNGARDANFGQINSVRSVPRQLQLSAKYQF